MKFHQRGGTILGLILGILLGLGVALAVAVYVTKVPVPFVNKGQTRTSDQDAAEAKKNKDWDPNAPLYGKNPARPAAVASGAVPAATGTTGPAATASAPVVKAAPGATGPTSAGAKAPSADPLGDLAKAKTGTPAVPSVSAAGAVDPFTYFVQAGAFRTPEDAEAQRAKLMLLGVEAKVTEREQSGRTVYRVRLGPFDRKEDAEKSKEKLDASGNETAIVRIQR